MRIQLVNVANRNYIPLALYYLKAYVEADAALVGKVAVDVIEPPDINDIEAIAAGVAQSKPDIVGFSCYIWNADTMFALCQRVKEVLPTVRIIIGGPELATHSEKTLQEHDYIDAIVRGEGEETFRELLTTLLERDWGWGSLARVKGLTFRAGQQIQATPAREIIEDLDRIPSPYALGLLDLKNETRTILFESYRGCPFKCSYCYYPKDFGKLIHSYSMPRVEEDLRLILASGAKELLLMDPTFNVPPKRAKEILRIIANNPHHADLSVSTEVRVDLLDEEMIDLLSQARINVIEIGLQSSNADVLKVVDRRQNLDKIRRNTATMKRFGIRVVSQLIVGLPTETLDSFDASVDYSASIDADQIEAYQLQLLPGTPMYRDAEKLELEFIDEPPRKIISTGTMTATDIMEGLKLRMITDLMHNTGIARNTVKWLANHFDQRFSQFMRSYFAWRTKALTVAGEGLPQRNKRFGKLRADWAEATSTYPRMDSDAWIGLADLGLEAFVTDERGASADTARLIAALRSLLQYDFHTWATGRPDEPLAGEDALIRTAAAGAEIAKRSISVVELPYDPLLLIANPRELGEPAPTWLVFLPRANARVVTTFFNGVWTTPRDAYVVPATVAEQIRDDSRAYVPYDEVLRQVGPPGELARVAGT